MRPEAKALSAVTNGWQLFADWKPPCLHETQPSNLAQALELAVPLEIHHLMKYDGPSQCTWERMERLAKKRGKLPDADTDLLFGGALAGESFTFLSQALAIMAFAIGGVRFDGYHWMVCHWGDYTGIQGGKDYAYAFEGWDQPYYTNQLKVQEAA